MFPSLSRLQRGGSCLLKRGLSWQRSYTSAAAEGNKKARQELAASYRAMEKYNFHEGVCNHLSLMAPAASGQGGEVMLLIPYGLHWSEVTASSLVGLNEQNEIVEGDGGAELSAATIHQGVHQIRTDAKAVFHLHTPYSTALGCLKDPTLKMVHQNCVLYHNNVAYDMAYDGLSCDVDEGRRLGRTLGDKNVLFMCNHGTIAVGPNCATAFDRHYYLERACMYQMLAMATGRELKELPQDVLERTVKHYNESFDMSENHEAHFMAMYRKLQRECPEFEE